jgi:hypothetical protein
MTPRQNNSPASASRSTPERSSAADVKSNNSREAKVEIEARLQIANHALERLGSFVSIRGNDLQCPRCWITNEVIANLRPASGSDSAQQFRCETCKSDFNLQI